MKTTLPWTTLPMFKAQPLTSNMPLLGCLPFSNSMALPASCLWSLNPFLTDLLSSVLLLSNSADPDRSQVLWGQGPDSSSQPPTGLFPRQTTLQPLLWWRPATGTDQSDWKSVMPGVNPSPFGLGMNCWGHCWNSSPSMSAGISTPDEYPPPWSHRSIDYAHTMPSTVSSLSPVHLLTT